MVLASWRFSLLKVVVVLLIITAIVPLQVRGREENLRVAANRGKIYSLQIDKPIIRRLAVNQTHTYQSTLAANHFLHLTLEPHSIDLLITAWDPENRKLTEINTADRSPGIQSVYLITPTPGNYRIVMQATMREAMIGNYQVKVESLRPAGPFDRDNFAAQQAFLEGMKSSRATTTEMLEKALSSYTEALSYWRVAANRREEAETLDNIGLIHNYLGEKQKALDCHHQALLLRRVVGDRAGEATTLYNTGTIYYSLGELKAALDCYQQVLKLWRELGNHIGEANTLHSLGLAYNFLGEKSEALDYYQQALVLQRTLTLRTQEARTLDSIGAVYRSLGEMARALGYYQQALVLERTMGDRYGEAYSLHNIGSVHDANGDWQMALDYYQQSLIIFREVRNVGGEAYTLNNLGAVYDSQGERQEALNYYRQALALMRVTGNRGGEAGTLHNIGGVYEALGQWQTAGEYYRESLSGRQWVGDRIGEALTLFGLARIARVLDNLDVARSRIEEALLLLEQVRTGLASQHLRASYFAQVQEYYEFYIDLLMQLHQRYPERGYNAEALQASERARARTLLEMLVEARADLRRGVDPQLLAQEQGLRQQLNTQAARLTRLLAENRNNEQAVTVRQEVDGILEELQKVEARMRKENPRYRALSYPQPLSVIELQEQVVDANTVLLEYVLGKERSFLWVVTANSVTSYQLPSRSEIESLARRVYQLLTARQPVLAETPDQYRQRVVKADTEYWPAAAQLSSMLLAPVAPLLQGKRVLIVPDGILHYLPFAALPSPTVVPSQVAVSATQPYPLLIAENEIVYLPSALTITLMRRELTQRQLATKMIAVLADPVFDSNDPRVRQQRRLQSIKSGKSVASSGRKRISTERGQAEGIGIANEVLPFTRLGFSRQEAAEIISLVGKEQSREALGFEASRATALSPELAQYRYIHFATHGLANSSYPELSSIVLSLVDQAGRPQDGFLRLHEIYNLNLPAELVVLSACRTGFGKVMRGEGLIGLTRGFMHAGAARVMASLWNIDDSATAELMGSFYRGMLQRKQSPAAALRAAQLSMAASKRWQAPYYWAAFVLQGEYR
ncbi:MAG: CHAT domain-containing protein, partial [Acidobacteriota bacterium]